MFARHFSAGARFGFSVVAGLLLFSSASHAANEHDQRHIWGSGYGIDDSEIDESRVRVGVPYSTPSDYSSSDVCYGGYRWITRRISPNDTPAQNAIPVRCE